MKTKVVKYALAATLIAVGAQAAMAAGGHVPVVKDYADANIMPWISDSAVVAAIKAQNEANANLSQSDIDALDKQWRAGVDGGDTNLIDNVLGNSLSDFLRDKQIASNGIITEIFVMDAKGLNVGQSDVTSDYWQGDEGKWKKTYGSGDAAAVFVDEPEKDESTQMLQSQVSMTIADTSGAPIGAITIGINLDAL